MTRPATSYARYSSVAVLLHWAIATLIIFNLFTGLIHEDLSKPMRAVVMKLHFSSGLTVLLLTALRVYWRLTHRPPPLDPSIPKTQRLAANVVYGLFYALMIGMPLGGWALISTHPPRPGPALMLWGVIPWPAIGPLTTIQPEAAQKQLHETFATMHGLGGWIMLGLLALHVAGALKHQFLDHLPEVQRMTLGGSA